jgi:hypothetical protein
MLRLRQRLQRSLAMCTAWAQAGSLGTSRRFRSFRTFGPVTALPTLTAAAISAPTTVTTTTTLTTTLTTTITATTTATTAAATSATIITITTTPTTGKDLRNKRLIATRAE